MDITQRKKKLICEILQLLFTRFQLLHDNFYASYQLHLIQSIQLKSHSFILQFNSTLTTYCLLVIVIMVVIILGCLTKSFVL